MKGKALREWMDNEEELQVSGYQIDSRKVGPGELFFALPGARVDGHRFLGEVRARGGVGAVVLRDYAGEDFGLELIRVEDVEEALRAFARRSMERCKAQIVGVTGSVGKTTTKEFIATLLEGKYRVGKSLGNYNTKLTVPLTLLNRMGDEEVLVLEMGVGAPGDMDRLLGVVAPEVAVLTKVGLAHAAFFPGGLAEIRREKGKLLERARVGVAYHGFGEGKVSFSIENPAADYFVSFGEDRYWVDEKGVRVCSLAFPFQESHLLENGLAAVAVARAMKMDWEEIERQVPKLRPPKMRFERLEREGIVFINDAYNANPASMLAALRNLPMPQEGKKRIGVLGTMKELGACSEEAHREVGREAMKVIDHLLVLGEEAAPLGEAYAEGKKPVELFVDVEALVERLKSLLSAGDVVLVKGSRSMEMERIVDSFIV